MIGHHDPCANTPNLLRFEFFDLSANRADEVRFDQPDCWTLHFHCDEILGTYD